MDEMERGKEGKDVAKRRREQGGGQVSRVRDDDDFNGQPGSLSLR